MKNLITFLVSSVILTLVVYLFFYATEGDYAMSEMETYKDWIAVSVILLSIAIAFVADKIRRRREDELDFGYVSKPKPRQERVQPEYTDFQSNEDEDTDVDEQIFVSQSSNDGGYDEEDEDEDDGFYNHSVHIRYFIDSDESFEDYVKVGVEDEEFDKLSEDEYLGIDLDTEYIADNYTQLHDRIIMAIQNQIKQAHFELFHGYSPINGEGYYTIGGEIDYEVLYLG